MAEKFTRWDAADQLNTEEDVALYLDACLEDDPGDGSLVRAALNDIARARGMPLLTHYTCVTRVAFYRVHPTAGNPEFSTVLKVIKALKIRLHAAPAVVAKPRRTRKTVKELATARLRGGCRLARADFR